MIVRTLSCVAAVAALAGSAFAQASFTATGYAENFNSLGTAGTTRPAGWSHWFAIGDNLTFTAATTNAGIATGMPSTDWTLRSIPLATFTQAGVTPPANQSSTSTATTATYGYNAALSSNTANRILGSAGVTGVAAAAMQLAVVNNSGVALNTLNISYDFVALSNGTAQGTGVNPFLNGNESELPGFRVFYSVNGNAGPWTNVAGLNVIPPTGTTVGTVINRSVTSLALASAWNPGSTLTIRWFDDNENLSSPDPLAGIDNISIVPTPGAAALLSLGGLALVRRRR
jgi:uncharacterized protein (TIGR03382 family)